jgi:hypothetical protein
MRAAALLLPCLAAAACGAEAPEPENTTRYEPLASPEDWSQVERTADPFVTDAAQAPACLGPGFSAENTWLEVDTGVCNWVTLQASARLMVEPRQRLRLVVSHYDLSAIAPAEARLELRFGDCELWQESVAIPSPAAVYDEELESPCAIEQGAPMLFHLHNHGQNNWQLQELSAALAP